MLSINHRKNTTVIKEYILHKSQEELFFLKTGQKIEEAEQSQMFGKLCFKINKKAFVCYFERSMVFKLSGDIHHRAISLKGSKLFDPSGKNRPMKEWIQVPFEYNSLWEEFAYAAADYVAGKINS